MASTFKFADLNIELADELKPRPDSDNLVFGQHYSDHMFECSWTTKTGWKTPKILPLHTIDLHPAAKVLHYAIEVFDGMKAYRGEDNEVRLFRPDLVMNRLNSAAERASMPTFDGDELTECVKKLIVIDGDWVPASTRSTLYIRLALIATEGNLSMTTPNECLLFVITGPVGPYYPENQSVSLLADPTHCRVWKGGTGAFKMGANYQTTIYLQHRAMQQYNCQQVLWLCSRQHFICEVGSMNFFCYWITDAGEEELLTPPLTGGIVLPGITRQSILELVRGWGTVKVTEEPITMKQLIDGIEQQRVKELFGSSVACDVCPIGMIRYGKRLLYIPTMQEGAPFIMSIYKELVDIQNGVKMSPWVCEVNVVRPPKAGIDVGDLPQPGKLLPKNYLMPTQAKLKR